MLYHLGIFRHQRLMLISPRDTEKRLENTCYRLTDAPRAGNFNRWRSTHDVLADDEAYRLLRTRLIEELSNDTEQLEDGETFSVTIKHSRRIGWASTGPFDDYPLGILEPYAPNKRSTVLMVRRDSGHLAPATKDVTFILSASLGKGEARFYIRSIYPGPDIGELQGDLTERERIVMFGWEHPGAAID